MANTIKDTLEVFSAHAEVVPKSSPSGIAGRCILRARGGSSLDLKIARLFEEYSPRTRR